MVRRGRPAASRGSFPVIRAWPPRWLRMAGADGGTDSRRSSSCSMGNGLFELLLQVSATVAERSNKKGAAAGNPGRFCYFYVVPKKLGISTRGVNHWMLLDLVSGSSRGPG